MSRIGKLPIQLPAGVELTVSSENEVTVKGPLGVLTQKVDPCISFSIDNGVVSLTRQSEAKEHKSKHGLYRALVANLVTGVSTGFTKSITINGVGFKCAVAGNKLTLNIGFSHPVVVDIPEGLTVTCPSITEIVVSGIDKVQVGQWAADVKAIKKVEPYHGYGIYYTNEHVRRKEIKKTSSGKK